MPSKLRIASMAAVALLLLPVAAAGVAVLTFDANAYKPRIIEAVRRATGRELVLAGPLHLTPSLHPVIEARDVALANAPGGSRPQMVSVGEVRAQVALLPLLRRRVEIESVTLVRPDILVETDMAGRGNWEFDRPVAASTSADTPSVPARRTEIDLERIHVQDGKLTWRNGGTGRTLGADRVTAEIEAGAKPMHAIAAFGYDGLPFELELTSGTVAELQGSDRWPLNIRLTQAGAAATFAGEHGPQAAGQSTDWRGMTGRLEAVVPAMTPFAARFGRPELAPLNDVHLAIGKASTASGASDINLHAGPSDLSAMVPGLRLTQLDVAWPDLAQPMRLKAAGAFGGMAWELAGGATPIAGGLAFRGLTATLGAVGDIAGDIAVTMAGVPAVRGTLVSKRLDIDALPRSADPLPQPAAAVAPPSAAVPSPPATIISDRPLPFAALRRFNADFEATIGTLHAGGADLHGVATHAVLRNGALNLDPLTVQSPRADLSFSTDASQSPPPVALAARAAGFALRPLLASLGLPAGSDAAVDIDLALHSAGETPHALASALDGHAGLAVVDAEVENALLARLLGGVLRAANVPIDLGGRSHLRCLALRLDAADGHVDVRTLNLDSTRLRLDGSGTVDLGAETMALKLRPELLLGGTGVLAPVQLGGSFGHPQPSLDAPGAPGRVGVVIGGAPREDNCAADLTAARDGRAGPMPAAAAARSLKPADLLRNFLR